MKSKLFVVIATLFALTACKDDNSNFGDITTSKDTVTFAADQLTNQQVTVSFDGFWYFKVSESWVTVTRNEDELTISVSKNNSFSERTATLTVMAVVEGGPSKDITIIQNGLPESEQPKLELSTTEVVFSPVDPQPVVVEVYTAGGVEWAAYASADDLMFFNMTANEDNTAVIFTPYGNNESGMQYRKEVTFFNKNSKVQVPVVKLTVSQGLAN